MGKLQASPAITNNVAYVTNHILHKHKTIIKYIGTILYNCCNYYVTWYGKIL